MRRARPLSMAPSTLLVSPTTSIASWGQAGTQKPHSVQAESTISRSLPRTEIASTGQARTHAMQATHRSFMERLRLTAYRTADLPEPAAAHYPARRPHMGSAPPEHRYKKQALDRRAPPPRSPHTVSLGDDFGYQAIYYRDLRCLSPLGKAPAGICGEADTIPAGVQALSGLGVLALMVTGESRWSRCDRLYAPNVVVVRAIDVTGYW